MGDAEELLELKAEERQINEQLRKGVSSEKEKQLNAELDFLAKRKRILLKRM